MHRSEPLLSNVKIKVKRGLETHTFARIIVEPGTINSIITLESNEENSPCKSTHSIPTSSNPLVRLKSPIVVSENCLPSLPLVSNECDSVVPCLKKLALVTRKKTLKKKLNFSSITN